MDLGQEEISNSGVDKGDLAEEKDDVLENTIDSLTNSANEAGSGGLCRDPRHNHSFRSMPYLMVPLYTCAGCGNRLKPYVLGGSASPHAAVQCVACGVYAHRTCAFSKYIEWETKCSVVNDEKQTTKSNGATSEQAIDVDDDDSIETFITNFKNTRGTAQSIQNNSTPLPTPKNDSDYVSFDSIFRGGASPETRESPGRTNFPSISAAASMDDGLIDHTAHNDGQYTKANFPFLSSARLLPSHRSGDNEKDPIPAIQRCQTWNGVVESTSPSILEKKENALDEEILSQQEDGGPKDYNNDNIEPEIDQSTTEGENSIPAPLHYATNGFQVFAQALQENIIDNFSRLIPIDNSKKDVDHPEESDLSNLDNDDSSMAETKSIERGKSTSEEQGEEKDGEPARSLLEISKPQAESGMDRKKIGLATVAGTIVGGVVGVGLAGPVGGVIGVKCGQTAGMLGLLLEGSVTASVVASGIGVGMAAGQHIQEEHETRVLALGEGTKQRALLMVRPTIQAPEPIWDELYQQAKRSHSDNNSGIVNMLIPNESRTAKRERYEREVDIVDTGEDELAIADKVLLLVSRILSNKESLPGHVYRKLIEAFRSRCDELNLKDLSLHEPKKQKVEDGAADNTSSQKGSESSIAASEDEKDVERSSETYQRRRDAHAVIKYVTTSLLLTRPGFGHSPSITEKTATAVESLVFGEIYDLVMDEIEMEHHSPDDLLLDKIAEFERKQNQKSSSTEDSNDPPFNYKSCISEAALEALHCMPQAHSAVDKLRYGVVFLEQISEHFSKSEVKSVMGADSLLKMVCQHILVAKVMGINSQIAFLEEFARDEQLLRGKEGYALVTLQASLHFLNASEDFESDIFGRDDEE